MRPVVYGMMLLAMVPKDGATETTLSGTSFCDGWYVRETVAKGQKQP